MDIGTTVTIAAAHFVHTTETPCKRIHGHNWKINVEINGTIQKDGMVIDFTRIKEIINSLDHKFLIPSQSIGVRNSGYKYMVELYDLNTGYIYAVVPNECIQMVDVPVITAEYLAEFLYNAIKSMPEKPLIVKVVVWESEKSYAQY